MSKRKSLTPMLDYVGIRLAEESHVDVVRYRRELRAVKAVLREAATHARLTEWAHKNGDQTCGQDWLIVRALARLRRGTR